MECSRGIAMGILSVRLSVHLPNACIVTKRKKSQSRFLYHAIDNLAFLTSLVSVVFAVYTVQVVSAVRAVDSRCEWVRRQAVRRADRCQLLSEITRQLQQQAELCVARQRHLLSRAITRRGVRALRCDHDDKRTHGSI